MNKYDEDWISTGDLCWFCKKQRAYPADLGTWKYSDNIIRILSPTDPIIYMRRVQEGNNGEWVHYIECLGLYYVFIGGYKSFTKQSPRLRGFVPGAQGFYGGL